LPFRYGDPAAAAYWSLPDDQRPTQLDFYDTFLDISHVRASFPGCEVVLSPGIEPDPPPPYRLTIPPAVPRGGGEAGAATPRPVITVEPYLERPAGPYPGDAPRRNPVRFTRMQVRAWRRK
jgi:intron-binding protein aquarius